MCHVVIIRRRYACLHKETLGTTDYCPAQQDANTTSGVHSTCQNRVLQHRKQFIRTRECQFCIDRRVVVGGAQMWPSGYRESFHTIPYAVRHWGDMVAKSLLMEGNDRGWFPGGRSRASQEESN